MNRNKIIFIVGLILLIAAIVLMVTKTTDNNHQPKIVAKTKHIIPEHIIRPDGPEIFFPRSARADNYEVNAFVYKFIKVLLANDYKHYRLMVTQQREPVSREKFEHAYGKVKTIRITKIEKLKDPKILKQAGLVGCKLPAYKIEAHIVLRDKRQRDIKLYVFRERNQWVSSN